MNLNNGIDLNLQSLENLKLEDYQIEIFENLKLIGEEIALFYLDGIKIYKSSSFQTKPYLLAHIAREIEGGIRDIWASPYRICPHCGKKLSRNQNECKCGKYNRPTHREEIAKILGLDKEHSFVKEWYEIASKFARLAHRHGPWKKLRDDREIDELWRKFERKILSNFIGRFLNLINQVEKFFSFSKPTKEILDTLENVLRNKVLANYFFKKLEHIEWLPHLKEKGFFSPEKAPGPEPADKEGFYTIPYWNVLAYLERVSKQVSQSDSKEYKEYIDKLLEIIKEVTEYHKETKELDNYHIWSPFIRILSNLPTDKISMEIIDLIPVWFDSKFGTEPQTIEIVENLLPKLLEDNAENVRKVERIIEYLTEVIEQEGEKSIRASIYWFEKFFEDENHLKIIAEKSSIKIIEIFAERIKQLISTEYEGTLYSLYDSETFLLKEKPAELFIHILSRLLLIKTKKEPKNIEKILKSFFEEPHLVFTKIALFVIGQNTEIFRELFWEVLEDKEEKIFEGATLYWGDEVKKVLENLGPLNDTQRKLLKEKIEEAFEIYAQMLEETLEGKDKEEKKKWKLAFKQMIYKTLAYDEEFRKLYKEIKEIAGIDAELSPAIRMGKVRMGPGKSPLSVEQILEMGNDKLAEYLIEFKTIDFWEGPTVEGLAETLKTAVRTKPQKFTQNLEPFLNIGYLYVAGILEGLQEALKAGKSIDYEEILDFVEKYINRNEFWDGKFIVESPLAPAKHTRVISAFCFFITEIFQNKSYPLPEKLFEKVERLIYLILKKSKSEETEKEITDYISYSLNTPLGRVVETYIEFTLVVTQSSSDKRKSIVKNFIEKYKELLKEPAIEAYTFFGTYFLSFYFHIDKNFTTKVVKSLKPSEETWEAFMEGYFTIGCTYKEIYELMREHYEASLRFNFKDEHYKRLLADHISLAYLIGLESLEASGSLFYKLIKNLEPENINRIIWFFWRQKDYLKDDNTRTRQVKKRILDFWQFIYNKLKGKYPRLSEKEEEILSNIAKLTVFLPELTEPYKDWLIFSAEFIKDAVTFSSDYLRRFIETGDRIKTAEVIGKVLLKAHVPLYLREDKAKFLIAYLCGTNDERIKKMAKDICNKYIEAGKFSLKEVCEECN